MTLHPQTHIAHKGQEAHIDTKIAPLVPADVEVWAGDHLEL